MRIYFSALGLVAAQDLAATEDTNESLADPADAPLCLNDWHDTFDGENPEAFNIALYDIANTETADTGSHYKNAVTACYVCMEDLLSTKNCMVYQETTCHAFNTKIGLGTLRGRTEYEADTNVDKEVEEEWFASTKALIGSEDCRYVMYRANPANKDKGRPQMLADIAKHPERPFYSPVATTAFENCCNNEVPRDKICRGNPAKCCTALHKWVRPGQPNFCEDLPEPEAESESTTDSDPPPESSGGSQQEP